MSNVPLLTPPLACVQIKFWERKQNALAYYWFTSDLASEEKVRREFYIAIDAVDNRPAAVSAVSGAGFGLGSASDKDDGFTGVSHMSEAVDVSNVRKLNKKTGQVEEKVRPAVSDADASAGKLEGAHSSSMK